MKTILLSAVALGAISGAALAEPVEMNLGQLDQVAGGVEVTDGVDTMALPMGTDLEYTGSGKGCGYCTPGLALATGHEESWAFTKDSGAAVVYGNGPGMAAVTTMSDAIAKSAVTVIATGGL